MFDVGWSEILSVSVLALILVGPKELPTLLCNIGRYTGMAKRQFEAFRAQLDVAMSDADLDLVRKEMDALRQAADNEAASARNALSRPAPSNERPR